MATEMSKWVEIISSVIMKFAWLNKYSLYTLAFGSIVITSKKYLLLEEPRYT